jgi:hypothetical protein
MKFRFTEKEEKLLVLFLALHQHKNTFLASYKKILHPVVPKTLAGSKNLSVQKELIKLLKEYHPYQFVAWLYGDKTHVFNEHQSRLLRSFIKGKNLYDLIKINRGSLKRIILKEEKKWESGLAILKSAINKLPFFCQVKLVLNLFDGYGTGYGINTTKGIGYIVVGPHREFLNDQVILHEYLHIIFANWFQTDRGKEFISLLLKKPLKNKWQVAKRPWYPKKEAIAEEYFLRVLTLRFLPKNLKSVFIKENKRQGFKYINELAKWLLQFKSLNLFVNTPIQSRCTFRMH